MTRWHLLPLRPHARFLLVALLVAGPTACSPPSSRSHLLDDLHHAIHETVTSKEMSRGHSRLTEDVVQSNILFNMTRDQVADALGRGDPCSRHPKCAEKGFGANDWYYTVGEDGSAQLPVLIVGFDSSGRVARTWNLRTH